MLFQVNLPGVQFSKHPLDNYSLIRFYTFDVFDDILMYMQKIFSTLSNFCYKCTDAVSKR